MHVGHRLTILYMVQYDFTKGHPLEEGLPPCLLLYNSTHGIQLYKDCQRVSSPPTKSKTHPYFLTHLSYMVLSFIKFTYYT